MELDGLSGETLAHFRIEHRIGSGGMGIVYRAEDVALRRPVALKVMRPEQIADERRRARFLREARTAAGLVHPNIAAVYEVGEAQGAIFIAMELVIGESLRELLQRGPIDVNKATAWATDIAGALARAHEAGIVHRDLKPDNVMITRDGHVKLLDFGIAKALAAESGSGDPALEATDVQAMTADGTLVGTPEYMSPEQAQSRKIDVRSDLFSFGAVLFEMLVGQSPFRRGNVVETAIAISRDPTPSMRKLRREIPAELDAVVARCLSKEPRDRYADGAELQTALRSAGNRTGSLRSPLAETLAEAAQKAAPGRRRPALARVGLIAGGLAIAGAIVATVVGVRHGVVASSPDAAPQSVPAPVAPTAYGERMIGGGRENNGWTFAMAPDGSRIVFDDGTGVWLQELPAGGRVPLPVPEADVRSIAGIDFVGVDRIAYVVSARARHATEIWTLGLNDGAPRRARTDALDVDAASVSPDGRSVAYVTRAGVHSGAIDGPTPKRFATLAEGEYIQSLAWSPASDGFAYTHGRYADHRAEIVWSSADGGRAHEILRSEGLTGNYGGGGIAFSAADRLLVLRYDASASRLVEIALGDGGAPAGERALFRWDGELVSQVRAGGGRISYSRGTPNGSLVEFPLAAGGERIEGTPRLLYETAWVLRPLGYIDDTHVAVTEEQEGIFHVISVSTSGAVAPYVKGPLTWAYLVPGGDVLYWTKADGGRCTLMRHSAKDGAELPAPMAGTSCDEPIRCVKARCIAVEESEDLLTTFRDWDAESGATGPPLAQIKASRVRSAVSDDGRWLVTAQGKGRLRLFDLAHGGAEKEIATTVPEKPQWLTFTPDGKRVLFVGYGSPDVEGSFFGIATASLDGKVSTLLTDTLRWSNEPHVARDGRSFVVGRKNFGAHLWMLEPQ